MNTVFYNNYIQIFKNRKVLKTAEITLVNSKVNTNYWQ